MTFPPALLGCDLRDGAPESELLSAEKLLGQTLPEDYKEIMRRSNGLEGFIAEESYLILWSALELARLNLAYAVSESAPGSFLFGTDGGDTGYGFQVVRDYSEYIAVPLIGLNNEEILVCGRSFFDLLEHITN